MEKGGVAHGGGDSHIKRMGFLRVKVTILVPLRVLIQPQKVHKGVEFLHYLLGLAYGDCARNTSGSQNLAVLSTRHRG